MIKKLGRPITAGRKEMTPRNPSTSLNSARQAEQQISTPPAPFKTTQGIVQQGSPRMNMARLGQPYTKPSAPGYVPNDDPGTEIADHMTPGEHLRAIGYPQATNFTDRPVHANTRAAGFEKPSKAGVSAIKKLVNRNKVSLNKKRIYPGIFNRYNG